MGDPIAHHVEIDMSQPLEHMAALAKANMQLALKLAQSWREAGQKVFAIAGEGAAQAVDEARTVLVKEVEGNAGLVPGTGQFEAYMGKLALVRETTAKDIEVAVAQWRESLSSATNSAIDATQEFPFDALLKPWLTGLRELAPSSASKGE